MPKSCDCVECRCLATSHEGIFLIKSQDVDKYLSDYKPVQLRWNNKRKCHPDYPVRNFGESKGQTLDRVLIYPTKEMIKWVENDSHPLKNEARAKLYVALTRARHSAAIVVN